MVGANEARWQSREDERGGKERGGTRICASDKGRLQSGENLVKRGRPLALWLYMVASAVCMRFPCISGGHTSRLDAYDRSCDLSLRVFRYIREKLKILERPCA